MTKIFESEWRGFGEFAQKIHVHACESVEEEIKICGSTCKEVREMLDVPEPPYYVQPGGLYYEYDLAIDPPHIIIWERMSYNV